MYLYKNADIVRESRRYHAVLLVKIGKKVSEVAELLFTTEDTIRSWIKKWDSEKSIRDKQRPGKPCKLTKEEEEELCRLVDENNPENHGYNVSGWDCVELQTYVKDKFNKNVSAETIRKILKRNGFNYKKINYLFSKRDMEARKKFVQEIMDLYELISNNKLKNTILMFADQISTKLHPKPGYVWTRDNKVFVETLCSHKRLSTLAAIEPLIGEKIHATYDKNNSDSFVEFIDKLEKKKPDKNIILVLDNYPVHHSKKVKERLKKSGRIQIKFLPTYSPDLNPIEWLWGYVRKKYLNNRQCKTREELFEKLENSFNSITPDKIKHICPMSIIEKHLII